MTNRFDVLTQQLFQKNIDDCSVEELQNLAHDYPYFAPAQYALLLKLKTTDHNGYQAQLQKAILYYHDPLVFDQFINAEDYGVDFTVKEQEFEISNELTTTYDQAENEVEVNRVTDNIPNEEIKYNEAELANELEIEVHRTASNEDIKDTEPEPIEVKEPEVEVADREAIPNDVVELKKEEERIVKDETPVEELNNIKAEHTIDSKEKTTTDSGLAFEPYHTVDYFASQGIKLSQEEVTKDKFGKQLKSFTEWLKTMKKLPAAAQAKPIDVRSEEIVENLAAHSVEKEEVYTETMAEVWLRQGNREKAMEIYNKLSLLNPSKRAYFAAKIDSLK
jgi:hypothetical protein